MSVGGVRGATRSRNPLRRTRSDFLAIAHDWTPGPPASAIDMIEVDVRPHAGDVVVAHDPLHPDATGTRSLRSVVAEVASELPDVWLQLDVKEAGCEEAVVAALRDSSWDPARVLASSYFPPALRRLRELEPQMHLGLSFPRDPIGVSRVRALAPVVLLAVLVLRLALLVRSRRAFGVGFDAVMLHHALVTRRVVAAFHAQDIAVVVWTVDRPGRLRRVLALGVDGVVSNKPAIFGRPV